MTRRTLLTLGALLALAAPLAAQDRPTGIRVEGEYDVRQRPVIAVRPFSGAGPIAEVVDSMATIVARDLRFSDRYNMIEQIPADLRTGAVDVAKWNALRVTYLVTGEVTATTRGYELRVVVHDVPWSKITYDVRYALPAATGADFRMAVHAVSDDVVRRTLNVPGIAATRIALSRTNPAPRGMTATQDLLIVDSDGFGVRRLAGFGGQLYSPSWSRDGQKLLYTMNGNRGWQLAERNMATGTQRVFEPFGETVMTPSYMPSGNEVAVGIWLKGGNRTEIVAYDMTRSSVRRLSAPGRHDEMYPVFSADGRRMAFLSSRLGVPAIYVGNADGSGAQLITPFQPGVTSYYTSPTFSPLDSRLAFHGTWDKKASNSYHILVSDAANPGGQIIQVTEQGHNEDPSWAPDGRHLVYTQTEVRGQPDGLYVIDIQSKVRRLLVPGANMRMADWSPPLVSAASLAR
jgi:TolB protein